MKLSEAIAMLEKNPKLRFKRYNDYIFCNSSGFIYFERLSCIGGQPIPKDYSGGNFEGNVTVYQDWQLVREPVPWQEAIQAALDGKRVICEGCKGCSPKFQCLNRDRGIIGKGGWNPCLDQIKTGTWYIEE